MLTVTRAFNFGEFVDGKAQQPVPAALAPHEGEVSDIFDKCRGLAVRILYLLGVGLEVRPLRLTPRYISPKQKNVWWRTG